MWERCTELYNDRKGKMSKLNNFLLQFGTDKFLHFVGGACVMAITNSWIVLAIVSAGKEVYDQMVYGGFDKKDLFATMLGGVFAFFAEMLWKLLPFNLF